MDPEVFSWKSRDPHLSQSINLSSSQGYLKWEWWDPALSPSRCAKQKFHRLCGLFRSAVQCLVENSCRIRLHGSSKFSKVVEKGWQKPVADLKGEKNTCLIRYGKKVWFGMIFVYITDLEIDSQLPGRSSGLLQPYAFVALTQNGRRNQLQNQWGNPPSI